MRLLNAWVPDLDSNAPVGLQLGLCILPSGSCAGGSCEGSVLPAGLRTLRWLLGKIFFGTFLYSFLRPVVSGPGPGADVRTPEVIFYEVANYNLWAGKLNDPNRVRGGNSTWWRSCHIRQEAGHTDEQYFCTNWKKNEQSRNNKYIYFKSTLGNYKK